MKRALLAGGVGLLLLSTGCATAGAGPFAAAAVDTNDWTQWRAHEVRAGSLRPRSAWHMASFQGFVDYRYFSSMSAALAAGSPESLYVRGHDFFDPHPIDPQTGGRYYAKDAPVTAR
jgi:hypothetical protein